MAVESAVGRKFTREQWRFWEPFLRLFGPVEVLSVEDVEPASVEDDAPASGGEQMLLGSRAMWR